MREQLPLATIHDAVLEFLRGRDDVVLFNQFFQRVYRSLFHRVRFSHDAKLIVHFQHR